MPAATLKDLDRELEDLGDRYPKLGRDELFVLWFLRAYVTEDEDEAVNALTGGSGDKGADAILVDDAAKVVVVVQGKLRKQLSQKAELPNDVVSFAALAEVVSGDKQNFDKHVPGLAPAVKDRLHEARERITRRKYRLQLYYVTLGRFTKAVVEAAQRTVRYAPCESRIEFIDGRSAMRLLEDYLDGVAPPIPSLDLEVEAGHGIQTSGPLTRYDSRTEIDSWVFSMTGEAVGHLYEHAGIRLFARNIRGFLGSTKINEGMQDTIQREPEYFWYYNNGITIMCDGAKEVKSRGRTVVRVSNPQVINGQQTTRTLHGEGKSSRQSSVLVRVIAVQRDGDLPGQVFESLISRIVAATNWQNAIRPSDLMANDRQQVEIERQLRKFGYGYLRKRQTKREAHRVLKSHKLRLLKKEEVAQAVAGCDLDPGVLRLGKERLFEEDRYHQVFATADPLYYLVRYWLMRSVGYVSKGYPERAYAKWLVLHFMWTQISPVLKGRPAQVAFVRSSERNGPAAVELTWATDKAFVAALRFFRATRGKGAHAADVSSFFRRRGLHKEFAKFWGSGGNSSRKGFRRYLRKFEAALKEEMEQ
jgi:hypothetical protein